MDTHHPTNMSPPWSQEHNQAAAAEGWSIFEREHVVLKPTFTEGGYRTEQSVDAVSARIELPNGATIFDPLKVVWEYGPTPLIAAMRCFVASKLGDEVDVPDELLSA